MKRVDLSHGDPSWCQAETEQVSDSQVTRSSFVDPSGTGDLPMTRTMMLMAVLVIGLTSVATAQQVVQQAAPRTTRSYRSYSVTPAPRGDVRRDGRHATEATWRHANAKAAGHYSAGR